ncbi:Fc.00g086910.m01.CDS01 [Cosmosporella sp. VM-42]
MSANEAQPVRVLVDPSEARRLAEDILKAIDVPAENAAIVAKCLVSADLRGVDTHGINRIPSYLERIRLGSLDPTVQPILKQVTPVVTQVDANNGWGFVAAHAGMKSAIASAEIYGIGMAGIKHSNHYGMAAWLVQQAIDANMMSLVFTNSSPAMPPWGGKTKCIGVSPIACGAPGKDSASSFILDMAPSIAARGKIYKAMRRGEKIPKTWAADSDGRPTDDPVAALKGFMLPMGGPKGSGLAIMMDVFAGVLSGSAFAGNVTGPSEPGKVANVGHFIVAIKPDLFLSLEEFKERMHHLYGRVVGGEKAAGVERIYFPGEPERLLKLEREKGGIPMAQAEVDALNAEATKLSVNPLSVLS